MHLARAKAESSDLANLIWDHLNVQAKAPDEMVAHPGLGIQGFAGTQLGVCMPWIRKSK